MISAKPDVILSLWLRRVAKRSAEGRPDAIWANFDPALDRRATPVDVLLAAQGMVNHIRLGPVDARSVSTLGLEDAYVREAMVLFVSAFHLIDSADSELRKVQGAHWYRPSVMLYMTAFDHIVKAWEALISCYYTVSGGLLRTAFEASIVALAVSDDQPLAERWLEADTSSDTRQRVTYVEAMKVLDGRWATKMPEYVEWQKNRRDLWRLLCMLAHANPSSVQRVIGRELDDEAQLATDTVTFGGLWGSARWSRVLAGVHLRVSVEALTSLGLAFLLFLPPGEVWNNRMLAVCQAILKAKDDGRVA